VSEVELAGVESGLEVISADNFVDSNAHERVMLRRASIVDVVGPFRDNQAN
jgi:hypothetical protein